MPSQQYDVCQCGKRKRAVSKRCRSCHDEALWEQRRENKERGYGPLALEIKVDGGRVVDVRSAQDPMVRPPHYPPACTMCKGFGYVKVIMLNPHKTFHHSCPNCKDHPGHAMSFQAWAELRKAAE